MSTEASRVLPVQGRGLLAPFCLAGAVFLWGTSFMATKAALAGFAPMGVIWLRMTLASFTVLLVRRRIPAPKYMAGDWKVLAFLCLMQPCLYFLLEGYAISLTTSSQAGMISSLVPLLVAAGAWIVLREPMSGRGLFGLLVSIGGVICLSLGGSADAAAPNPVLGNLLEVGAMICVAMYMVVMKRLSARYPTWWLTGMQCVAGAVFFLPGVCIGNPMPLADVPLTAWLAVAYLGLFVTLGAFGLYNMAMTSMPVGRAAMAINLVSPVALVAGWLMLGETLSALQLGACGVVGVGVWLGRKG
ncbi:MULTISPECIES: DMT family transporter [unclassified Pseudodesulfovibrio]|uniref:DMT family transporter n=1 Tax=unclassified Pseudodesulfovibrio TaxID=2661612 RepID=UPI000FEC092D|nr:MULTISPECIES: DMT family transporter [unclassified Pseudodesulfovibrio]MCJ2166308.1 DMT family transporter [Pseudodesulfovibrio sp. S3-i]RWU02248.1 DMT family transporter [Pseudodesulfovibrio sp. S3]